MRQLTAVLIVVMSCFSIRCYADSGLPYEKHLIQKKPSSLSSDLFIIVKVAKHDDQSPMEGVKVTIAGSSTGFTNSGNTDTVGSLNFFDLKADDYFLTIENDGYETHKAMVTLRNQSFQFSFELYAQGKSPKNNGKIDGYVIDSTIKELAA